MNNTLYKRDSNGKIRVVYLHLNYHTPTDGEFYSITGETGLLNGKLVKRPLITIQEGKSTRTIQQQANLQYNSLISSYLDKGYKDGVSLGIINNSDIEEIEAKVPIENTDTKGMKKPMLAKSVANVKNLVWTDKWYCSRKLDGVRCLIYKQDDIIQTSSRGGQDYNIAAHYIINDPLIKHIFELHPDIILDGELYIHGKPLSYISGIVRLDNLCDKHKELEFHCYDIVDEKADFSTRLIKLKLLGLRSSNSTKLKICEHHLRTDEKSIWELHDKWVADGYEGLVMRHEKNKYKCGIRSATMLKIKTFTDAEFEIIDIVNGLREEDMCFLLKTSDGNEFKAKPIGDRELKQYYRNNIDQIRGKMGKVKYFGYTTTDKPVPNLPVFISIREKSDI